MTLLPAEPGTIRTDANGTQWHLTANGWQPFAVPTPGRCSDARRPEPELEAS